MSTDKTAADNAIRDALKSCVAFMSVEMGWEYFRADFEIGKSPSASAQNAMMLKNEIARLRAISPELDALVREALSDAGR